MNEAIDVSTSKLELSAFVNLIYKESFPMHGHTILKYIRIDMKARGWQGLNWIYLA
jgi:hypothetical protein